MNAFVPPCDRFAGLRVKVEEFLTCPASALPLAVLRIGLAGVLLVQAAALAPSLTQLYGPLGVIQWPITHHLVPSGLPRVDWLVEALAPLGVSAAACLRTVFLLYVFSLSCLLIGWHTRVAAVLAWLTHLMLNTSGHPAAYGVDSFAHFALFYCMWFPVGHAASLDCAAGRVPHGPTFAARLSLRVLQLHLCIAYFSAGLAKAMGEQWWNGEAIWLALMQPILGQFDVTWLASMPWVAQIACWGTIVIEAGYPLLVWPQRTRKVWVLLTVALHLGTAVGMGLVSFAAVMIVLNVAAFLVSPEPR